MTYVKKLVMKGFKSFPRETTITFDKNLNVIVGPNGSGKSNITDALCFVLGRLSIKSMRAARASHLIFAGTKEYKPFNEAFVEIIFDNSEKKFAFEEEEIRIRRIVRKNGQSIYKINNETKTRQEVLELLAQVGIDPHGFNIILQGEIERFVKMPADDRRKVIEEVAEISVYEMRKEKSLKELERTDEKIKQITAVLKERTTYMKNLEEEKEQALKFKKLQETVKRCKASIIFRNMQQRQRETDEINKKIQSKRQEIQKKSEIILKTENEISNLNLKIDEIARKIQTSSGIEQDSLLNEITLLKQDIAGMTARKENFENQVNELKRRKQNILENINVVENEIELLSKEKGKNRKKDLEEKKAKLEKIEEEKRKFYILKSNLSSLNSTIEDKKRQIQSNKNESMFILSSIEQLESQIKIRDSIEKHYSFLLELKNKIREYKIKIKELEDLRIEKEKIFAVKQKEIEKAEKIKQQVSKLDICPLCQTKITKEHISHVLKNADKEIKEAESIIKTSEKEINNILKEIQNLEEKTNESVSEISTREIDIIKISSINDKKEQLKRNQENLKIIEKEFESMQNKKRNLELSISEAKTSEESYENLKLDIAELERAESKNLSEEIKMKQRDLEQTRVIIKQINRDEESIINELKDINDSLNEKQSVADEKEEQAEILRRKYQKMFEEKNKMQDNIRLFESNLMRQQNEKRLFEDEINNINISNAEIRAKLETLVQEYREFEGIEVIQAPVEKLIEKMNNCQQILDRLGSVNLKALEVYDEIKKQYDEIYQKVEQLNKEKTELLLVIEQIDRKKRKVFMNTLEKVNELFTRNFAQLSEKGLVSLDVQDKEHIFEKGLDIIIKMGAKKTFDVTSLSGGEQCLVAISLIFAIQELKPYSFYIFDEIDAALDKRNSEKLANLLKRYMKQGQYIIITHNDSLISEASNTLYGVSMQEGISKIVSLDV